MTGSVLSGFRLLQLSTSAQLRPLEGVLRAAGPPLLFGLRLWASVSLALYAAFWLQLSNPFWAGASAAIVCQPQLGASLRKGWFRMLGTIVGAVASVVLIACFPQDRVPFLIALASWGGACAFAATLLRNFASYAASLAGYTSAIIAGDLLGTVGGVDATAAFMLAVTRATEICLGIGCAGIVLAGTDFGGVRRRLATLIAQLAGDVTAGLSGTLASGTAGTEFDDLQEVQRELVRRVVALDPIIDQAVGESSEIRYYAPVLQRAVDGLFSALVGWHAVANHLAKLPVNEAHQAATTLLKNLPQELRSAPEPGAAARWLAHPAAVHRIYQTAVPPLTALPAGTPSLRLLADKTAEAFTGIAHALDGLALLVADPARPALRPGRNRPHVPDWLPALVSAGRTFATIVAVSLFWIVTGWPGGGLAMTFAAIVTLLLAPRSEETYGAAVLFVIGGILDLMLTAIVSFAVLPGLSTHGFAAFSLVMGVCLVPLGTLLKSARQPWQVGLLTAMTMGFVPILQPTNPETYDALLFYNIASAIVAGMGAAALSFRLLPPLSPVFRAHRLLALTLRDLRRLAKGATQGDWESRVIGRLAAMPNEGAPLERAQLLTALSVGSAIVYLRHFAQRFDRGATFGAALEALEEGDSASAIVHLSRLDEVLAAESTDAQGTQDALRARGNILVISETLTRPASLFDAGVPR
ncbi:FUSC family protein [Rhizobium indigoferae]|uniref:FUSC family protein n=1 Tax=Rhizobium indigoferae TaxID=158891 RepID=A0ABZ1DU16_9HYPH|nr:FUSC family protein [Rhizobium indigoferae]NNU58260.1 FUSC family protein [Rhizobium indigoferae]WRW39393.1 FUSC family protein [Rhizobium indigoferae]GLR56777.1 fusaric acid resistance protein [Rhizobium indigoferae]